MFTVIIQWPLLLGLSVTFQDRMGMGCKKEDAIVRSIADFEVPDVLVCLPSFKCLVVVFSAKSRTLTPLHHFPCFPIFNYSC